MMMKNLRYYGNADTYPTFACRHTPWSRCPNIHDVHHMQCLCNAAPRSCKGCKLGQLKPHALDLQRL